MTTIISKALRDDILGDAAARRPGLEKQLTTIYRKHAERTATRLGLPLSSEDLDRIASRSLYRFPG